MFVLSSAHCLSRLLAIVWELKRQLATPSGRVDNYRSVRGETQHDDIHGGASALVFLCEISHFNNGEKRANPGALRVRA